MGSQPWCPKVIFTFDERFNVYRPMVFDRFLYENKFKNGIKYHILILRERVHLALLKEGVVKSQNRPYYFIV
jgi:hypothetical protein